MKLKDLNGLRAPKSYVEAPLEVKERIVNKCGPDGVINHLVPNHLLGLDISESCDIHDWMFAEAENQRAHQQSDVVFLKNIKTQIRKSKTNSLLKSVRYGMAYIYFGAVRIYSFLTKNTSRSSEKKESK